MFGGQISVGTHNYVRRPNLYMSNVADLVRYDSKMSVRDDCTAQARLLGKAVTRSGFKR
jgi:hypothetical protein